METKDYLKDIQDIKNMMSQSTQFISLSGLSGVLAGIYALIGAYVAHLTIQMKADYNYDNALAATEKDVVNKLLCIAASVIVLSVLTGIIFSAAKSKKNGETLWNATSKRLLVNFSIPLISGGLFALQLLSLKHYGLLAPVMLLFYGMACVNASKHTLRDVRYLGITLIILGLVSSYFSGYGLQFWALGFGVCHILYGTIMYFKYDRN